MLDVARRRGEPRFWGLAQDDVARVRAEHLEMRVVVEEYWRHGDPLPTPNDQLVECRIIHLLKIDMAGMIRGSFRKAMSKRGLWTLEAVHGQTAVLSPANVGAAAMRASTHCLNVQQTAGRVHGREVPFPR